MPKIGFLINALILKKVSKNKTFLKGKKTDYFCCRRIKVNSEDRPYYEAERQGQEKVTFEISYCTSI
jgi:hypothetical protein